MATLSLPAPCSASLLRPTAIVVALGIGFSPAAAAAQASGADDGSGASLETASGRPTSQAQIWRSLGVSLLAPASGQTQTPFVVPSEYSPDAYVVYLPSPPTGYWEKFLVQLPPLVPTEPVPLLTVFHAFGQTHNDVANNTEFLELAAARNWMVFAPLGGSKKHFSSIESQYNTELGFAWLNGAFSEWIDPERHYGVGFSMGGGAALNYAATHLDPSEPMFAGLVNHTGGMSLRQTWVADPKVQWILELWFGGTPEEQGFYYDRSSVIDLDPVALTVNPDTDLARNLTHVPISNVVGQFDPLTYLLKSTRNFHEHLVELGGSSQIETVMTFSHTWDTLDQAAALDFLAPLRRTLPDAASTLAVSDDRYFYFDVEQDAPGAFTRFDWSVDRSANILRLTETDNLEQLSFSVGELGLDTASGAQIGLFSMAADGTGDVLVVHGLPQEPISVLIDGIPFGGAIWDPSELSLRLDLPAVAGEPPVPVTEMTISL